MKKSTFADVPIGEFFITRVGGGLNGLFKRIPRTFQRRNHTTNMANAIALWEKSPNDTYLYHFDGDTEIKKANLGGKMVDFYHNENTTHLDEVLSKLPLTESQKLILQTVRTLARPTVDMVIDKLEGRLGKSRISFDIDFLIDQNYLRFNRWWNICVNSTKRIEG